MSIEPRPLSKELLAEITDRSENNGWSGQPYDEDPYDFIKELLAAERFWREAVRDAEEQPSDNCAFCESSLWVEHGHKAGCKWLLAQDNEEGGRK